MNIYELKFSHEEMFTLREIKDARKYLSERFQTWIIEKFAMITGAIDFDGIIVKIWYSEKPEDQLFRERFESLMDRLDIMESSSPKPVPYGVCPECKRKVAGWEPLFGGLAPEWWATMREHGIDPSTGHSILCTNKQFK